MQIFFYQRPGSIVRTLIGWGLFIQIICFPYYDNMVVETYQREIVECAKELRLSNDLFLRIFRLERDLVDVQQQVIRTADSGIGYLPDILAEVRCRRPGQIIHLHT